MALYYTQTDFLLGWYLGLKAFAAAVLSLLKKRGLFPGLKLKCAGSMTEGDAGYVEKLKARLAAAGCANDVEWHPNVSRGQHDFRHESRRRCLENRQLDLLGRRAGARQLAQQPQRIFDVGLHRLEEIRRVPAVDYAVIARQ